MSDGSGDLGNLMERARQMQEQLGTLQRDLARRTVEASAGGGMVTVTATGALRILKIEIDPQLATGDDRTMLQDLVAAGVNAALERAQRMVQEEMQRAAGGLSFPAVPPSSDPGA